MPIFVFSGCFLLLLYCRAKRSETANWLKHQDQDLIDEMLTVYFKSFPQNSRNNPSNSVSLNRLKGKRLTSWFLAIPSLCLVKSRHRCQLLTRWINHFLTLLTKYFDNEIEEGKAFGTFRIFPATAQRIANEDNSLQLHEKCQKNCCNWWYLMNMLCISYFM